VHGDISALHRLLSSFASEVDLIVCLGDLTNEGSKRMVQSMLKMLKKTGKKVFVVPGNMDGKETVDLIEQEGFLLDERSEFFNGFVFVGIGGAIAKNTWYKNMVGELQLKKVFSELSQSKNKLVYLTHVPPFGSLLDFSRSGIHLGSKELKNAILEFSPLLALSGHVHEARGKEVIGRTVCVNPGALKDGFAAIIKIDAGIEVEWIDLAK